MHEQRHLLSSLIDLARAAGGVIMQIYQSDFSVDQKSDASPVTAADQQAEQLILSGLRALAPDIAVIAEEEAAAGRLPPPADRFFLVDPLDGTREFVGRNGEFTVNIALIENGQPCMGVVFAPALPRLFAGAAGLGAFELDPASHEPGSELLSIARQLKPGASHERPLRALTSRSHGDAKTTNFLSTLGDVETVTAGSSLKFCLLAAGEGDIYPRFGPTMEWDTAAGQAIVEAAGGAVLMDSGTALTYGKHNKGYRNPAFFAYATADLASTVLLRPAR